MNRQYISTAHFNAPYQGAHFLSGLGDWPQGRSYWSTANFRAPYNQGYFQDNSLMGFKDNATVVMRQIPTWAFVVSGVGLSYLAYKGYKRNKNKKKAE